MSTISDYRELRVYAAAFELAMELFAASKDWPRQEQYALTDQVRRSSRAVCANIAEAWFKRRYPRHFVSKLSNAGAEASETLVWIDFAEHCGYLDAEDAAPHRHRLQGIIGGLVKMMGHPEQWCLPPDTLREPDLPFGSLLDSPPPPFPASP